MNEHDDQRAMTKVCEEIYAELKGELESLGIPTRAAEHMAEQQLESPQHEPLTSATEPIAQHVVPVSRGWVVMRRFALTDAELFPNRKLAEARAYDLARHAHSCVVIHDSSGRVEREVDFSTDEPVSEAPR